MPSDPLMRRAFFLDCADHEFAETEGGRMFYFRVTEVPTPVRAIYSRDMDSAEWEPWWEEYLTLKYLALAYFNRHPRAQTKTLLRHVSLPEEYEQVMIKWRSLAPVERQVFRLRLDQIDDLEIVQTTWYDDIPSFADWGTSCTESVVTARAPGSQIAGRDVVVNLLAERALMLGTCGDVEGKHVIDLLEELRGISRDHLAGAEPEDVFLGSSPDGASSVDPVAIILAQSLLALRTEGEMRLEKYIDIVITVVKTQFKASVVDFLLLRKHPGREQLELLRTTAEISQEKRRELEREAAYTRPAGITGSVLVAQRHNARFHVGTNRLQDDPRQSLLHLHAFEEPYGDVENFWVFPVYVRSGFLGALRVVNHLNDREEVVPWPYLARRRLAGMLPSVAVFLEGCEHPPASKPATAPSPVRVYEFAERSDEVRKAAVVDMASREALLLDTGALEHLLMSFASLAEIRIEDRWLALTTIVVSDDRAGKIRELITESTYRQQSVLPTLAELDTWSCQYPDRVIVVTMDGTLLGTLRITKRGSCSPASLSSLHGVDLVLEQPRALHGLIELWRGGERLADYAFLPRLGTWSLRELARGRSAMSTKIAGPARAVHRVLDHAIGLSYKHGSLILLMAREDLPSKFPISDEGETVGEAISEMSTDQFGEYATRDGAAIVSAGGVVESAKETLPTEAPAEIAPAMRKAMAQSQRLLRASARGKRHESAMMASLHYPKSAVFCASQGRTVCVFVGGEAVLWDF